jgi:hypothetical protein
VYGLPARPLTDEEEWLLDECMSFAEARIAHIHVLAARIARGEVGPIEYYGLDAVSPKDAERRMDEARMTADLRRVANR